MQYIRGYKWNTPEEANADMVKLNEFYGLPVKDGNSYFSEISYGIINDFYFLSENEMLTPVLGEPIEIEIEIN
jgi:hypothetical protein